MFFGQQAQRSPVRLLQLCREAQATLSSHQLRKTLDSALVYSRLTVTAGALKGMTSTTWFTAFEIRECRRRQLWRLRLVSEQSKAVSAVDLVTNTPADDAFACDPCSKICADSTVEWTPSRQRKRAPRLDNTQTTRLLQTAFDACCFLKSRQSA